MGTVHSQTGEVILKTLLDAIVEFDINGKIEEWNTQAETLFGWPHDEVQEKSFFEICLAPEFHKKVLDHLHDLSNSHETVGEEFELKLLRKNGDFFDGEMILIPIRQGNELLFQATLRDVTSRKQNELVQQGQKRIFEMLTSRGSLREILTAVIRVIEERFKVRCSILLMDDDKKHLRFGSAPSLPNEFNEAVDGLEIGPCSGSCGTAAYRCDTVVIQDIKIDPLWAGFRELGLQSGIRACWSKPIISEKGQVLGTLCMYYEHPRQPTPEESELMGTSTHLVGIAIERGQATSELETRSKEVNQLKDVLSTKDERIQSLKDEIEQLRTKLAEKTLH
jgi:PAS domain S-box-containing protein